MAPSSSARPVRSFRTASASSASNTSTGIAIPRFSADCRALVIITRAAPLTGTNGRSTSGSSASSNTSRQRSPSASSSCRTIRPALGVSRAEPPTCSPAASTTAARPASRLPVPEALIQATRRQPSASFACAYTAASWVLPTPRLPVTTCTTDVPRLARWRCPSRYGRGWKPGGRCGILPTTTCSLATPHIGGSRISVWSSSSGASRISVWSSSSSRCGLFPASSWSTRYSPRERAQDERHVIVGGINIPPDVLLLPNIAVGLVAGHGPLPSSLARGPGLGDP